MIRCEEDLKAIKEIIAKIDSMMEDGKHIPEDISTYYEFLKYEVLKYENNKNRTR